MSSADDMLKKMRADTTKDAPAAPAIDPETIYTKLIIFRQRRQLLTVVALAFFAFAFVILVHDLRAARPWLVTALPITIVGLIIALVPATEEWEYKPWQTKPRQYEHHHHER